MKNLPETRFSVPSLLALGAFGYGLRLILWISSEGSNDVRFWYRFARNIAAGGLGELYFSDRLFNHPPLMGLWSASALYVSTAASVPFPWVFKFPSLLAELATGLLAFSAWKARGQSPRAAAAFAAYGTSISCIVISAHHGNTDPLYFCFAMAAAYLMEAKRAPFWSGVALGAAINVKLIPILLVAPLASRCTRLKDALRYVGGLSLGAAPFLCALWAFEPWQRQAYLRNMLTYGSSVDSWGVQLPLLWLFRWSRQLGTGSADGVRAVGEWYHGAGSKLLLVASAAFAIWHFCVSRRDGRSDRTRLDAYELSAMTFACFLVFGSGFGVQYVGCIVAPLAACRVAASVAVSTATGVFITAVYIYFVATWRPLYSDHRHPIPLWLSPLSIVAWSSVALVGWRMIVDARRRPAAT